MAQHLLFEFPFSDTDYPFTANSNLPTSRVIVSWETTTNAIVVSLPVLNPPHYTGTRGGELAQFTFCDGNTLNQFRFITDYPYAERLQTADSPACVFAPACDAHIQNPLLITRANAGYPDGSVTVRAFTTAPPLLYSLDNQNWQTSPVFNNLNAGSYTAYIKDANGCRDRKNFTLNENPEYGLRFVNYYQDSLGDGTRIEVRQRGYTGSAEEVKSGDNPLVIKERGGELFTTLRGQECAITFLATRNLHYAELLSGDDREFLVEVYKNDDPFWKGWVVGDVYNEPYLPLPQPVSFSATDGIGELKETLFTEGNPEGTLTQWQILWHILGKINTQLPLISGVNLYETRMNQSETDEPFTQATVSLDAYYDDKAVFDCAKVLDAILKPYGAFIRQQGCKWHLGRIDEFRTSFVRRFYDRLGNYQTFDTLTPTRGITQPAVPDAFHWVERSQNLEIRPAYKQAAVHVDYGFRENFVRGGYMKEEDFQDLPGSTPRTHYYTPRYFEGPGLLSGRVLIDKKKKEYAMNIRTGGDITKLGYIRSERIFIKAEPGVKVALKFKFECKVNGTEIPGQTPWVYFVYAIRFNSDFLQYHIWEAPPGQSEWDPAYHQFTDSISGINSWHTTEFIARHPASDGWLTIEIYAVLGGNFYSLNGALVKTVEVNYVPMPGASGFGFVIPGGEEIAEEETFTTNNPQIYNYTPDETEVMHGDVVPYNNAAIIYRNLITINGQPSLDWKARGSTTDPAPILELLSKNLLAMNATGVRVLRGGLRGNYEWCNVIQETARGTRYFPASFEYNDRPRIINGEFIELLGTTSDVPQFTPALLEHNFSEYNEAEHN